VTYDARRTVFPTPTACNIFHTRVGSMERGTRHFRLTDTNPGWRKPRAGCRAVYAAVADPPAL